jgi:hypothetical protein
MRHDEGRLNPAAWAMDFRDEIDPPVAAVYSYTGTGTYTTSSGGSFHITWYASNGYSFDADISNKTPKAWSGEVSGMIEVEDV